MSISKEQQNIIDNLRTPIKSFRIFALEEIIKSGDSSEFLSILKEISLTEDDPECSMLISHAISAVQSRLSGETHTQSVKVSTSSDFLEKWQKADELEKMQIISNLPSRLPKDLRTIGPELLKGSSHVVTARVIRTFSRNWPEEQFNLILDGVHSDSLMLKLASLRTLVHIKPELLLEDLPQLLASSDPEIKALAIRGLVKIDQEEALKHLQALLLSPMQNERLAGIQNCPFLPFDIVKPLLLKYFAAETNSELLTKAGWIIEMNPDVEIPFMLFEIAERSPAKKADLVKKVLNEAVSLLDKSGILGNQFAAYMRKLQNWVNKRNALRYVRQIIARLDADKVAPEIEKNIIVTIKQPLIKETFKEALDWPISEKVKNRIQGYLGIQPSNEKLPETEVKKPVQTENISSNTQNLSQLEMLAGLTPEKAAERINQIILLVSHKSSTIETKIAALHCLTRCRLAGAEDIATKLIKHHDVSLATAAVEYLGIINPDCIFPYLGQCLKIADVGMKSAALGILKNFDYNQAISYLHVMLYSTDVQQQNMAIECMNQFDFALIRDMLTEFLCKDFHEQLIEAGLCHFAANPSSDNAYSLYKIEQAHKGKIAEQAKALREACPEATEELAANFVKPEEPQIQETTNVEAEVQTKEKEQTELNKIKEAKEAKEAELKERLRVEKEKKASKKPAYAYRSEAENPERNSKQQLIAIWELIKNFVQSKALPISIVILIISLSGFYYFFVPKGSSVQNIEKGSILITNKSTIEGNVTKVNNGVVTLVSPSGEVYIMTPRSDGFKTPELGQILRVSIVPYRRTKNGENVVKIRGMRIIQSFSKEFGGDSKK